MIKNERIKKVSICQNSLSSRNTFIVLNTNEVPELCGRYFWSEQYFKYTFYLSEIITKALPEEILVF